MQVPVSCNRDCGAGCPLSATVENGIITKITDSPLRGRWMSGCSRGYSSYRTLYRRDRLLTPLIKNRESGEFREAGWDEALDFTAERLEKIRTEYGPAAVLQLGGSGSCRGALHNTGRLASRFFGLFGGSVSASDSFSSAAVSYATPFVFGTPNAAVDAGSLMNTGFVLMPGANFADLRFGCELFNRLKYLRKSGVRMIVLDPRKTRTVTGLDAEWIRINPGTDAAFIAAVIYDLVENGGIDEDFTGRYTSGFEDFRQWLFEPPVKNPKWAARHCGTSVDQIREVAECYRTYHPAALLPGLSIQRNLGGEDASRMMMVLQAVTGNTGIPGGSSGANFWGPMPKVECGKIGPAPESAGADTRCRPVYGWAERILGGDPGISVKAGYNCGGNYAVQGADANKSAKALRALEFSVTHDLVMTPTAELCDVVLPVAGWLERNDIVFPEGNFLLYSAKAADPPPGVKTDYEIFSLLADRLGFGELFTANRGEAEWLDFFLSQSEIDDPAEFKNKGIWFGDGSARVALSDFIADPEGRPLNTPSGKIEISSEAFREAGGSPYPVFRPQELKRKFRLVTPHAVNRVNSQYVHGRKAPGGYLLMNESDGMAHGLSDGDTARVLSDSGSIQIRVKTTSDIIEGTLCLDCSYSNVLTSTEPTMPSGGSRTHSTFVDIEPV